MSWKYNFLFRTPINLLLVNLAVADIVLATFHITELVYSYIGTHPDGVAGKFVCSLRNGTLQWIGAGASVFTVVAIAVERYFAVIYPQGNKGNLTMQKLKVCHYTLQTVSYLSSTSPRLYLYVTQPQ